MSADTMTNYISWETEPDYGKVPICQCDTCRAYKAGTLQALPWGHCNLSAPIGFVDENDEAPPLCNGCESAFTLAAEDLANEIAGTDWDAVYGLKGDGKRPRRQFRPMRQGPRQRRPRADD